MTRLRFLRSLAVLSTAGLVALACGGSSSSTSSGTADKGEIDIASDLPTSGADASDGLPTQQGAQFAITNYMQQHSSGLKGFKLVYKPYDDTVNGVHDAQKGTQNVQDMLTNNKVLAMVGPFNSSVAKSEIPVANRAPFAMISPSNTNECLTQPWSYCQSANGYTAQSLRPTGKNNYYRVAAADTNQGPAMADYAVDTLKATKIAVWSDNETFGKGVADNFAKELVKKGGTVVKRQDYDTKNTNDFRPFLTSARDAGAQAIYAAATSGTKVCIPRSQMKGIFSTDIFYLTPDGGVNTQCVKDAADQANDKMFGTTGTAQPTTDQQAVVDAYKKQFTKPEDVGSYTFAAYDCAAILIDAIGRAIDSNGGKMPSRQQVLDALLATKNFKGVTATYSFDQNGDPTTPALSLYQVKSGAWAFQKALTVTPLTPS